MLKNNGFWWFVSLIGPVSLILPTFSADHPTPSSLHRSSMCSPVMLATSDPALLRLISDGATRFLHHQLCEIAADCLQKSRDGLLSCAYFCNMSVRLDETLAEVSKRKKRDTLYSFKICIHFNVYFQFSGRN